MVFYVTIITFRMTLLMNKWINNVINVGWVHPLAKTLPFLVGNLWWNIVMDDWNLDKKSLGKWQWLQHCESVVPKKIHNEWQIMLNFYLILVTTHNGLQLVVVTLDIIFSVMFKNLLLECHFRTNPLLTKMHPLILFAGLRGNKVI